jgi:hypothetical protein
MRSSVSPSPTDERVEQAMLTVGEGLTLLRIR